MEEHTNDPKNHQSTSEHMDDSDNPTEAAPGESGRSRVSSGREMLVQLQQMIDTLATSAAPVMREVAAKAAELAAVAGEKAGPLAHRAAGMTEVVGQRVAARSKEVAKDLRRSQGHDDGAGDEKTQKESGSTGSEKNWQG